MNSPDPRRQRSSSPSPARHVRQNALVAVLVASVACGGLLAIANGDDGATRASASNTISKGTDPEASDPVAVAAAAAEAAATPDGAAATASSITPDTASPDGLQDLDGSDLTVADSCLLDVQSVRFGASGKSVICLQQALVSGGFYSGAASGTFDQATDNAVRAMQEDRGLFVDGVVGRESAISLGIWPDEASLVVHTPPPAAGAVDLMGYPLSSVAVSGPDAPPLPPNSGSGKRVVYDRAAQRVWAVNKDNQVVRSYLVAGSKYSNEMPGTHQVYSRSDVSTAWNGKAWLPKMIRWLKTDIGAIGFHAIPLHVEDDSPYMTEAELGQRLSGG
ncbi:MAG: peptidoglycan-binding domain-containing protein, partial [Ilumatobacteraceae bacterium]